VLLVLLCYMPLKAENVLGCAVVTYDNAYLFTDGRYFLQAEQQLDRSDIDCFSQYSELTLSKGTGR
jgi:hypothetical protein